jgi:hypothetical protein
MSTNPILRWSLLSLGLLLAIIVPFILFEQQVTAWSEADSGGARSLLGPA